MTPFKKVLNLFGFNTDRRRRLFKNINIRFIKSAISENGLGDLVGKLRKIVPDISNQEESERQVFDGYWELKRRTLQAFQCRLMLDALNGLPSNKLTVVDIGDSAGTHMLYLKALTSGLLEINSISVNLDKRAIEKIRARGLEAVLCRAEDLDLRERQADIFVSFEMLEHLHNPALFLRRLAKRSSCNRLVVTVPYLKKSRIGLHHLREGHDKSIFSEDEHIFELDPQDWALLILHSGWRVIQSKIYYQYPRKWLFFSRILAWYWRNTDFEGFWGAILEKDTKASDYYQDWEN